MFIVRHTNIRYYIVARTLAVSTARDCNLCLMLRDHRILFLEAFRVFQKRTYTESNEIIFVWTPYNGYIDTDSRHSSSTCTCVMTVYQLVEDSLHPNVRLHQNQGIGTSSTTAQPFSPLGEFLITPSAWLVKARLY